MEKRYCLKKLGELLDFLSEDLSYSGRIMEVFPVKVDAIPISISNVFRNYKIINNDFDFVFLGYDALSEEEILCQCKGKAGDKGFFGGYEYLDGRRLDPNMYIVLEDSLDGEEADASEIRDVSNLLPIFEYQGDYIVGIVDGETVGSLLTIVDGHIASYLAPSAFDHVKDLIEGLEEGVYRICDGDLVYPTTWWQRAKVRSGELQMDDFGDVKSL